MRSASSVNPVSPYCTGCGACVAPSRGKLTMDWDGDGFLIPIKTSDESLPKEVLQACPFKPQGTGGVSSDEDVLAKHIFPDASRSDEEIGLFENTYIGYSRQHRPTSSSGGIATYMFEKILNGGTADHLFVVVPEGAHYAYTLLSAPVGGTAISKTRYFPVTLQDLFVRIRSMEGRIAVSGVACFVKAVRMRQAEDADFAAKVSFVVGIICGGLKSSFFTDYLADRAGAGIGHHSEEYRVKDAASTSNDYSFSALDANDNPHQMKMRIVGDMWGTGLFKARACDYCTDVLTELADISLGDAWLPEYRKDGLGNSVIVSRSKLSDEIIRRGISSHELATEQCAAARVVESQRSSFLHRRDALGFRIGVAKLMRQPVPYARKRLLKRITFFYTLVQIQREVTRRLSFSSWRRTRSASAFERRLRPHLRLLRILTRINQRFRH